MQYASYSLGGWTPLDGKVEDCDKLSSLQ